MKKQKNGNNVILKEMRSQFKVFGDALSDISRKGGATFEAVGRLQEDFTVMKEDVAVLKEDVGVLKEDMKNVKSELKLIRGDLKEKADKSEMATLDRRVIALENTAKA